MASRPSSLPLQRSRRWRRLLEWTLPVALLGGAVQVISRWPAEPAPLQPGTPKTPSIEESPARLPAAVQHSRATTQSAELAVAHRLQPADSKAEAPACAADVNAGCARISGSVLDALGGSIVGARVSASDARGALLAAGASDGAGQFRLDLPAGLARVSARADGYSEQAQTIQAPLAGVRLVLAAESSIVGRVVVEDTRQPVADALVTVVNQDGPETEPRAIRTTEDGLFRVSGLLAGRHSLTAIAQHWRGEPQALVVGVAETLEPVELSVRAATPVRGVVQVGGAACARGSVFLQGLVNLYSELAADGSVAFDGVPPGRYMVDVRCVGALSHSEPLELESTPVTRTWELDRGLELRGVARSASNAPLAGAQIEVSAVGEPEGRADASCVSDERGEFSCFGLAPGEYDCAIGPGAPPRSDSVRIAMGAEAAPSVVLQAHPEGAIRVRFEGSGDLETRTLAVVARSAKQLLVAEPRGNELVFEPVLLGVYEVALDSAAPGTGRRVELTRPGEVAELTLPVPALQTIAGRVVDEAGQGVPDAWVSVAGTTSFAQFRPSTPVLTDAEGAFLVPSLLPARYQLSASSGRRAAELELDSASRDVVVTLREVAAASASGATASSTTAEATRGQR